MSGSHLMSMGKLYEWEKKLYEDVKVSYCYVLSSSFVLCELDL